jgi:cell fate (sporulation/competence/biofilm development) regulator YlbF (YheA/YmcA/DUF963 family)
MNNIGVYINAFLTKDGTVPSYQYTTNSWVDAINPDKYKFTFSPSPTQITLGDTGFFTNTIKMNGPSSELIGDSNKVLQPCTVMFYMNINTLPWDTQQNSSTVELLWVAMETPNRVRFWIEKDATTSSNVLIKAEVGKSGAALDSDGTEITQSWSVPSTSIKGLHLLTFVVDVSMTDANASSPTINMYIDDPNVASATDYNKNNEVLSSLYSNLSLGISPIVINYNANLDSKFYAFALYKALLQKGDISQLYNYFEQQQSGYDLLMQAKQAADAAAQASQQQAQQIAADAANQLSALQSNYSQCQANLANATSTNIMNAIDTLKNRWQISYGDSMTASVSTSDLGSCSPLKVQPTVSTPTQTPAAVTFPPSSPNSIAYPSQDVANASAAAPASCPSSTPVPTSTPAPSIWSTIASMT